MGHHWGILPLTSWHNLTFRKTRERKSRRFIFQIMQWIRIRVSQTIPEWHNLPMPYTIPSRLLMLTVASSMSFGFPGCHKQCMNIVIGYIYVYMWYAIYIFGLCDPCTYIAWKSTDYNYILYLSNLSVFASNFPMRKITQIRISAVISISSADVL